MAGGELFSIPASSPTIQIFREQQELEDIKIPCTWVNSKTLRVMVPLSKINQDPWGEKASLEAHCGEGTLLSCEDKGGDAFIISLPKVSDVHLKVGTSGSFRNWEVQKAFSIREEGLNSMGHPTFVLQSAGSMHYTLKIINETNGKEITSQPIRISQQSRTVELLTKPQWLSIRETSTLSFKICKPNHDEPFHEETVTVEPAPISAYQPSIDQQAGSFSRGQQLMRIRLKNLHTSQENSTAAFNWEGEDAEEVSIIDGILTVRVPLMKSSKQGFLTIPAQNKRLNVDAFSTCSEDTCSIERTRDSVMFSHSCSEEVFLGVNHTGDWEGSLCFELVLQASQSTMSDVLITKCIPLPLNGQDIIMNLAWLLERIPDLRTHILDSPHEAKFDLNIHLICGQNEADRSEEISIKLLQPTSTVQIDEELYFDEGREEPESVAFTYDRFYFEANEEFTLEIPGHEFVGTAQDGEITFEIHHPSIEKMHEDSVWKLVRHGKELLSGPYLVWPVEVHPPDKMATILVDRQFSTIAYPHSLFILQSQLLPTQTEMKLYLQIGDGKPQSVHRPFARGSDESPAALKQSVSMLQLFGDKQDKRNDAWLKKCEEHAPGKIGEYWIELPTRNHRYERKFPLHVEINDDASYLAALRYLKHQAASINMKSVSQFFGENLEHRDVVEDIILIVLGHVYHDLPGKKRVFDQALDYYAGRPGFHAHTQEFRLRMNNPFSFFFGLFGKEVKTGSTEGLKFMEDASRYFGRSTNKSKDDLARLWEVIANE